MEDRNRRLDYKIPWYVEFFGGFLIFFGFKVLIIFVLLILLLTNIRHQNPNFGKN